MQIATSNGNRWPLIWRAERLMPYGTTNDTVRVYQTERLCVIPHRCYRYIRSFRYFAGIFGEFILTARLRENFGNIATPLSRVVIYKSLLQLAMPIEQIPCDIYRKYHFFLHLFFICEFFNRLKCNFSFYKHFIK